MGKREADALDELAKEARRKYFREWRAKNRDKVKHHNDTYWRRKAQKQAEGGR